MAVNGAAARLVPIALGASYKDRGMRADQHDAVAVELTVRAASQRAEFHQHPPAKKRRLAPEEAAGASSKETGPAAAGEAPQAPPKEAPHASSKETPCAAPEEAPQAPPIESARASSKETEPAAPKGASQAPREEAPSATQESAPHMDVDEECGGAPQPAIEEETVDWSEERESQ